MKPYAFGADIGGTTIKIGCFRTSGELLDKWEIPTSTQDKGKGILTDLVQSIREKAQTRGFSINEVEGVGIGVPGAVLNESYVNPCVNLNGWGGDIAALFHKELDVPVRIINDANAAALGEMWQGGAKGHENVVFVTLGTGVGGGIIVGGRVISGSHGAAGEIGHIKIRVNEKEKCGCGKKGCLEQYASATGIVRMAKEALAGSSAKSSLRELKKFNCLSIFLAAEKGDAFSKRMIRKMADALGQALAAVSCSCDPEVIVIGGGVSKAGQPLIDEIRKAFIRYAFPASEDTKFVRAYLGNDAGIYGSVKLILQKEKAL